MRALLHFFSDTPFDSPIPLISHTRIRAYSRLREFHPLELTLPKAAPHHGGQPDHPVGQ
jgi:hypothetical protein